MDDTTPQARLKGDAKRISRCPTLWRTASIRRGSSALTYRKQQRILRRGLLHKTCNLTVNSSHYTQLLRSRRIDPSRRNPCRRKNRIDRTLLFHDLPGTSRVS